MDRSAGARPGSDGGFPRRRGDGPEIVWSYSGGGVFPPQARGWTPYDLGVFRQLMVSPAGAGMDLLCCRTAPRHSGFPRRRGDGPMASATGCGMWRFPPQARGWTAARHRRRLCPPVSPAGAGMDPQQGAAAPGAGRFPRRRGDGPRAGAPVSRPSPFPPQARGWTSGYWRPPISGGVSPAGAGMDRRRRVGRGVEVGFPRRRGDGPLQALIDEGEE